MHRFERLRWVLMAAALLGLLVLLARGATLARVAVTAACGAGWYALSRRKARSLDRGRERGLPL